MRWNSGGVLDGDLDSAYYGPYPQHMVGVLGTKQQSWITDALKANRGKKLIVLTHHNPLDLDGPPDKPFLDEVTTAFAGNEFRWYWGHAHNAGPFRKTFEFSRAVRWAQRHLIRTVDESTAH